MAFDYIEETKSVIDLLKAENAFEYAQKVKEALDNPFTSTELLMGVRFHLSKVQADSLSASAYDRIQSLIKEIDAILQR